MQRFFMQQMIVLSLLFSAFGASHAQQLYKCGNTYSQTPCAPDAAPKRVFSGGSSASAVAAGDKPSGLALCSAQAITRIDSPEPETAQVAPVGQRKTEVIQYANQPVVAVRYDLTVRAKTQYGVYGSPVGFACWLSEDQQRLLQLKKAS